MHYGVAPHTELDELRMLQNACTLFSKQALKRGTAPWLTQTMEADAAHYNNDRHTQQFLNALMRKQKMASTITSETTTLQKISSTSQRLQSKKERPANPQWMELR